jgi:hypothetical protein
LTNWSSSFRVAFHAAALDGATVEAHYRARLEAGQEEARFRRGDADASGKLDITDAVASLMSQFMGGTPPAPPGPTTCGSDPTPGDEYAECTYTKCHPRDVPPRGRDGDLTPARARTGRPVFFSS